MFYHWSSNLFKEQNFFFKTHWSFPLTDPVLVYLFIYLFFIYQLLEQLSHIANCALKMQRKKKTKENFVLKNFQWTLCDKFVELWSGPNILINAHRLICFMSLCPIIYRREKCFLFFFYLLLLNYTSAIDKRFRQAAACNAISCATKKFVYFLKFLSQLKTVPPHHRRFTDPTMWGCAEERRGYLLFESRNKNKQT